MTRSLWLGSVGCCAVLVIGGLGWGLLLAALWMALR